MNVIEAYHIPPAAAAIHLLCRVEQRMDLTFTMRELTDIRFQTEDNEMLLHKFAEGWSTHVRGSRSVALLATDVVPYTLWALSAGEGNVSLNRPASSFELLNQRELSAFVGHAHLLKGLGLTYVVAYDGPENDKRVNHRAAAVMRLEPPVDRLVNFVDLNVGALSRKEIAPAVR